jgi:peroxiredoxin
VTPAQGNGIGSARSDARRGALAGEGSAQHLKRGRRMPDLDLPTTAGRSVSFARTAGLAIVYCYPWTGRPGLPNPPNWDDIPGAHGSTPEAEGFRDLYAGFRQVGAAVYGLSTQPTGYQRELAGRLGLPFELVSDEGFAFQRALSLPTFETGGVTYLQRLTFALRDGRIEQVFYPVPLPAAHAREVCAWLGMRDRSDLNKVGGV